MSYYVPHLLVVSSSQWTSFNTTPTVTTTAPISIDPIDIPSLPPLSFGGTSGANLYDISGFAAPLESIQSTNDVSKDAITCLLYYGLYV